MTARDLTIALIAAVIGSGIGAYLRGFIGAWRADIRARARRPQR